MKMLYLYVDLGAFIVPFLFSFHPVIRFYRLWISALPAIALSAIPFLVWDSYFTTIGIWGFNDRYLSGLYLYNLPIEEVMFFVCIPYSCLFTYYCFTQLLNKQYFQRTEKWITPVLSGVLILLSIIYLHKDYTVSTFVSLAVLLLTLKYLFRVNWLQRFYFSYMILLIPFCIVNGILTGTGLSQPVVWYNNIENTGLRLSTIPLEDIFYGMLLIALNIAVFEYLRSVISTGKAITPPAPVSSANHRANR